jgi:hypothetical protein
MVPRTQDDAERALGEIVLRQFRFRRPRGVAHIGGGCEVTAGDTANVVDEHVVILGAAVGIGHDSFEYFKDGQRLYFEAGLFADLASSGILQEFTGFDDAAGQ